jgi:hypothetical protein
MDVLNAGSLADGQLGEFDVIHGLDGWLGCTTDEVHG